MKRAKTVKTNLKEDIINIKRNSANQKMLDEFMQRKNSKSDLPKVTIKNTDGKAAIYTDDVDDRLVNIVSLLNSFGTTSCNFQSYIMSELLDATCIGNKQEPYSEQNMNGIIAAMHSINPKDEIESMLASQMLATHFASMRCMRALKTSDIINQQDSNGNLAVKLMRTYTMQMEALQRYRGKGQQKMTVEHIHVHAGGQAIVGNLNHSQEGGEN